MMLATTLLALTALTPQSNGNLLGAATTMFVDAATAQANGLQAADGHWKPNGMFSQPPLVHPSVPNRPDFSPSVAPWSVQGLELDAFSTNLNWVAATSAGVATAQSDGGDGWAGIIVSTTRDTTGKQGSAFWPESQAGDIAADFFQYLFPDSSGVPQALIGQTLRCLDSQDLRLSSTAAVPADVAAMDLMVPILLGAQNTIGQLLWDFDGVVFSVRSADVGQVPAAWWNGTTPSGATLLQSLWNGVSWTTPRPFLLPAQIGLADTDDVDAVAWDSLHDRLLFSTTRLDLDPLLFVDLIAGLGGHHELMLPDSTSVSVAIGLKVKVLPQLRIDDVDAVCAIDPRIHDLAVILGQPTETPAATLNASLWREPIDPQEEPGEQLVALMTMPPLGIATVSEAQPMAATVAPAWAVLWLGVNGGAPSALTALPVGRTKAFQHRLDVPPVGIGFGEAQWKTYDQGLTALSRSAVVRIGL